MCMDDPFDNSEAQSTVTASGFSARGIGTVKTLKDMGEMLRGNADASITNDQARFRCGPFYRDLDLSSWICVADSVIEQVHHYLDEARLISQQYDLVGDLDLQLNVALCRELIEGGSYCFH